MTLNERRKHVLGVANMNREYQFGRPPKTTRTTRSGALGCGHQALSFVESVWHPTMPRLTQDEVGRLAGWPDPGQPSWQGLLTDQLLQGCRRLALPYKGVWDPDVDDLVWIARQKGPVFFLALYASLPEWKGYDYLGIKPDGRPNGYARPIGKAGANQLGGTYFGHWLTLLSSKWRPARNANDVWVRDSNHDSPIRPETPPFEIWTRNQLDLALNSFRAISTSHRTFAAVPTRALEV